MNEILEGMKVIKLYAWEPSFAKKIQKIRVEEISTLKKMSYLGAIQRFLFTTAPFMVTLTSFATFVLINESNILTAETAFVSLSYFNIMRRPLNQVTKSSKRTKVKEHVIATRKMEISLTRYFQFNFNKIYI